MIIYDEDYMRIYKQMSAERDRVDYYVRKCQKKALRHLSRTPAPCFYTEQLTFKDTQNTYLIYYYCLNEHERRSGNCFYGNLLLLNNKEGQRIAIRLMTFSDRSGHIQGRHDSLQIFTGHFFSRYRERFSDFNGLGTVELIASFAGRNLGYMYELNYNGMVLARNKTDKGCAWAMDDGFSLGEKEWVDGVMVVRHKTFLSEYDLKDDQFCQTIPKELMRAMLVNHYKN